MAIFKGQRFKNDVILLPDKAIPLWKTIINKNNYLSLQPLDVFFTKEIL